MTGFFEEEELFKEKIADARRSLSAEKVREIVEDVFPACDGSDTIIGSCVYEAAFAAADAGDLLLAVWIADQRPYNFTMLGAVVGGCCDEDLSRLKNKLAAGEWPEGDSFKRRII